MQAGFCSQCFNKRPFTLFEFTQNTFVFEALLITYQHLGRCQCINVTQIPTYPFKKRKMIFLFYWALLHAPLPNAR